MRCATSSEQINDRDFKWTNKQINNQNQDHNHDYFQKV